MNTWPEFGQAGSLSYEFVLPLFVRSAVVMLAMMLVIRGLLWLLAIRSPGVHRWASVIVLAQGWIIAPLIVSVPWYDPPPVATTQAAESATPNLELTANNDLAVPTPTLEPTNRHSSEAIDSAVVPRITTAQAMHGLLIFGGTVWLLGIASLLTAAIANYIKHCRQHHPHTAHDPLTKLPLRFTQRTGPMLCLLPRGYEIWVPADFWNSCTPAEQEAILRHELSHYRRGDVWKTWLIYLLALPQWFNPAAWWAVRNFQQAGEWLCDLDVANALPKNDYLQALLRLVELQPSRMTVAGQCAHAHPLLVRVRRLLSPGLQQDSSMKKLLFAAAAILAAVVPLVRIQLVARAADPPASLEAVHARMKELDGQLEKVKENLADLKERGESVKATIEAKVEELKKLAEDPTTLSEELKEKAKTFMGGDEKTQLEVVKAIGKLASQDEQVLALGRAIKDSPHESVRQQALSLVVAKGEAGYPAIAICFESLPGKDRAFLAKELNKHSTGNDKVLLFGLMAKNSDDELLGTLLDLELTQPQRMMFLASQADAKKDDEKFAAKVLEIADKCAGDDGLVLLYAIAKSASAKNAASAVKLAVKRKQDAWPVIAAAYKKEDKDCRAAVVRAAKEIGGEPGDFVVKHALEDGNAELRAAAEEAAK